MMCCQLLYPASRAGCSRPFCAAPVWMSGRLVDLKPKRRAEKDLCKQSQYSDKDFTQAVSEITLSETEQQRRG